VSAQPRILLVAPMHSHPPDQGNAARLAAFGAALRARGAWVELLYYGLEGLDPTREAAMRAAWDGFHYVAPLPHRRQSFPGFWGLDDWCPEALCQAVASVQAAHPFQAVIVNYVWLSAVLAAVPGALRVLDTHDLFGDRHVVARRDGLLPSWYFTSQAEEARGLARADLVLGIQDAESAELRQRGARRVLTVGHPPGLRFLHRAPGGAAVARFGLLASGNPWNVGAATALDAALADETGLDWLLAGGILRAPGLILRSAPQRLAVADAGAFYDAVDCVLNPMQGGTGLKIKTVEALGFGAPILGTRDAFAGLGAEHLAHQAADAAGVVALMREWIGSAPFRAEVALAGRVLALSYAAEVDRQYDALMTALEG
jgi:hypothetical protein